MSYMPTYKQAKDAAQVNADATGVPFVVFQDTNGNVRCERYDDTLTCHKQGTIFRPKETP